MSILIKYTLIYHEKNCHWTLSKKQSINLNTKNKLSIILLTLSQENCVIFLSKLRHTIISIFRLQDTKWRFGITARPMDLLYFSNEQNLNLIERYEIPRHDKYKIMARLMLDIIKKKNNQIWYIATDNNYWVNVHMIILCHGWITWYPFFSIIRIRIKICFKVSK